MDNQDLGLHNEKDRKAVYVALPVVALIAGMLYYFVFASDKHAPISVVNGSIFVDSDSDGIADHIDRCADESGTLINQGCLLPVQHGDLDQPAPLSASRPEVADNEFVELQPSVVHQAVDQTTSLRDLSSGSLESQSVPTVELVRPAKAEGPTSTGKASAQQFSTKTESIQATATQTESAQSTATHTETRQTTAANNDITQSAAQQPDKTTVEVVVADEQVLPPAATAALAANKKITTAKPLSDMDEDGVADVHDKCPDIAGSNSNSGCPASRIAALTANAKPKNSDNASTQLSAISNTMAKPATRTDAAMIINENKPVTSSEKRLIQDAGFNIQFEAGNTVLTGRSREMLIEVAKVMQRYPDIQLEAQGFTDSRGAADINIKLSKTRAQACIDVIAEAGIEKRRLHAIGFGAAQPVASNDTDLGRQQNRRVEFKLIR